MFKKISGQVKNSGINSFTSLVEFKHEFQQPAKSKNRRSGQSKRFDCNSIFILVNGSYEIFLKLVYFPSKKLNQCILFLPGELENATQHRERNNENHKGTFLLQEARLDHDISAIVEVIYLD